MAQGYFNRKAQQQLTYAQHPSNHMSNRLTKPVRGMNSTAVVADAEPLAAAMNDLSSPSVPASWLPIPQPQLSSNEQRSNSYAKASPHGTTAIPFLKEKANTPFEMKDKVTSTNQSVLSQSQNPERKSFDKDTQFKLNKLRNTYKPLIQVEQKERRPISIQ